MTRSPSGSRIGPIESRNTSRAASGAARELRALLRGAWQPMLAIHAIFFVLGFVVLGPLATGSVRLAVSLSGDAALSDTDILAQILTPFGALVALVCGSLLLTVSVLEYAALLVPARAVVHGGSASWSQALTLTFRAVPSILRLALRFIVHLLLIALPFMGAIGVIHLLLLGRYDINYYLSVKPPAFLWAVGLAACVITALAVVLVRTIGGWFYALPLVLFRGEHPKTAHRISRQTAIGRRWEISASIAAWLLGTPLLVWAISLPINALALWLAPRLSERVPVLALIFGIAWLFCAGAAIAIGFITFALLALQNARIFHLDQLDPGDLHGAGADPARRSLLLRGRTMWVAGLLGVVLAAAASHYWVGQIEVEDRALVIAHRGASGSAPENTMAAVCRAVDAGAEWVEIDVQESADGTVVVFHDSDFQRVGGRPLSIWDAKAEDLAGIDIGSWFAPEFEAERTPTLEEVLRECRGRSGVLIELKYYGRDEQLEQRVVDTVESVGMEDEVMVMSLDPKGIAKIRELRPGWRIGLLSTVALGDLTGLDVDFLGLNARAATPPLLSRCHKAGIDVYVWTVNTALDMSSMLSRGVDGLITDEPALARSVIKQRADLHPGERLLLEFSRSVGHDPGLLGQ